MSKPQITLDPSKLTMGDWETIEAFGDGKLRIGATMQIIARCSDWDIDRLRALPADAVQGIIEVVTDALQGMVNPKN